jgi:hypothetical protein
MTHAMVGAGLFAPVFDVGWLVVSTLMVVAAFVAFEWQRRRVAPPRPAAAARVASLRGDTPAVVNALTTDATVTAAGLRATVIDLAARGWLRLLPPDEDDDLGRVRPAADASHGDALRPHERLVLQHVIARFTTDRAIPARYLAVDVRGSWWRRFTRLVMDEARHDGLITRRWRLGDLVVPAALAFAGAMSWLAGSRSGSDVAVIDSIERRFLAAVVAVGLVVLVVRLVRAVTGHDSTLTNEGVAAARQWLAVRQRLNRTGFADLAPSAQHVGDRRLAYATAMGLAAGAAIELPLAREDHYRAWSSVGGTARLVRVRYPWRIGYGLTPYAAIGIGLVTWFLGLRLRAWADSVARGEGFDWAYEQLPEQDWLIADIATGLAFVSLVAVLVGIWLVVAGVADLFSPVERTGVVLRARRPVEVSPLPRRLRRLLDRDRYRVFIAVDDGSHDWVAAWRASERTAVPQGATATVKASRVLGRVRRSIPVGHRLDT